MLLMDGLRVRSTNQAAQSPTRSVALEHGRITVGADVFGGKPTIRDMRIAVEHVLGMLAAGDRVQTILDEYPDLEPEDIQACLLFAHRSLSGEHVHDRMSIR